MRRSRHGGRITAVYRTAIKSGRMAALALKRSKSVDFTGYWQRHIGN
jgi:hypothetical protein